MINIYTIISNYRLIDDAIVSRLFKKISLQAQLF
jgi:hypothetical protein